MKTEKWIRELPGALVGVVLVMGPMVLWVLEIYGIF